MNGLVVARSHRDGRGRGGGCDHQERDVCGDGIVCVLTALVVT